MRQGLTVFAAATMLTGVLMFAQSTTPGGPTAAVRADDPRDWPVYGGNAAGTRYSTLTQINRGNVSRLQVAWQFDPMDAPAGATGAGLQVNPIVIAGVVYTVTPGGRLVALDGAAGTIRWSFDSKSRGQRCRGVTYWSDGREQRILAGFGRYVYAIDATTGKQVEPFGRGGRIDLHQDLGRDPSTNTVDLTSPGVIYKDTYIVGGRTAESLPTFPGDVRAYDVRTGALVWSFHTIPHPGEYGYETWPKDAWTYIGSANNWTGMAVDTKRGIVYVPTGSPASDFYGGNRLGDGLFGNTLLALDAQTGKRIWHFQAVKHDIWDRDLDSPPTLITVRHNGRTIDAVAQASKHGYLFVFNRETGEPLFPIEYRKVPASTVPGEVTAETQPFPLKPAPFARTLLTEDMVSRRTPAIHDWALGQFKEFRSEGQFVPFSIGQETVVMPGFDGGAEWGGSAFDPETGNLFINANDLAWTSSMRQNLPTATVARRTYVNQCAACHGLDLAGAPGFPSLRDIGARRTAQQVSDIIRNGSARMPPAALPRPVHDALVQYVLTGDTKDDLSAPSSPADVSYNFTGYHRWYDPDGYPAVAPPWGTLNAINMNTGDYTWKIPLGEYPELVAAGLGDTGTENYGGPIVTAGGLVFIGATNFDNKFRAFDKDTGKLLWETTMVNAGNATPATYEANGRQYVIIPAFGGKAGRRGAAGPSSGGAFVVFALPADSSHR
jgi:quinoprotein glucose dehydrogenase